MITQLRSGLLCERVEYPGHGHPTYVGVYADKWIAGNDPDLMTDTLVLMLGCDGNQTTFSVQVAVEGFTSVPVALAIPAGHTGFSFDLPLLLPILRPGLLKMTLTDPARGLGPLRMDWRIEVMPGAHKAKPGAAAEFLLEAEKHFRSMAASYGGSATRQ